MESNNIRNMLEFLETVGRLKHTVRRGWEIRNISRPECIAGHMYRMAIISLLLDDKDNGLDRSKCIQMALVHDLAEAIVGDITPYCGIDPAEKHRMEDEAMMKMTCMLGPSGEHIYKLYKEYESQSTNEAKFVKDTDRFDMALQAFEYEKRNNEPKSLQEFFDVTKDKFDHPMIKNLSEELNMQRSLFNRSSHNGRNNRSY